MAVLKKFEAWSHTPTKEMFYLKGNINVSANGNFSFKFKETHVPFAKHLVSVRDFLSFNDKTSTLSCDNLGQLENSLQVICDAIAKSGVKEELLIAYKIKNKVNYYRFNDGTIDSSADKDADYNSENNTEGDWHGTLWSPDAGDLYEITVYARVVVRVTMEGSANIRYKNPFLTETLDVKKDTEVGAPNEYLTKLNYFKLPYPEDNSQEGYRFMPYTENRAKYFYDLLIGMCMLADRFKIFENEDTVIKLADSGKPLLMEKNDDKNKK